MVSSVNIHSWGKLHKPCMALKEQAFQLFSNILISMEIAEKSYFAGLICFHVCHSLLSCTAVSDIDSHQQIFGKVMHCLLH